MHFVLSVYMFPLSTIVLLDFGNAPTVWYLFVIHFVTFVLFVLDRMVVGFTTTYAISAYHHSRCEFEYSIQHYVIKLVSDLQQVGGLFRALYFRCSELSKK